MNIVWFSWKDINHPLAGGAETVSEELRRGLIKDGHKVIFVTALYNGASEHETIEGLEIIRVGGRYSVYPKARTYFKQHLNTWADIVIDEMNTIPFFAGKYAKKPALLLQYQLARRVWFYQMIFPFSVFGYVCEPIYLWIASRVYKSVATESLSSKQDIMRFGFHEKAVHVFRVGTHINPIKKLPTKNKSTVLILGAIRPMKRTLHAIKAFEFARQENQNINLIVAGDDKGNYAKKVKAYVDNSSHKDVITVLGRVSSEERLKLMRDAGVILVTSVKEGWGLIVTEANSQGTPAIAYDVDGLRDSVIDKKTGYLVKSGDTQLLGMKINQLLRSSRYEDIRKAAWENSKQYTFANSYLDFKHILERSDLL